MDEGIHMQLNSGSWLSKTYTWLTETSESPAKLRQRQLKERENRLAKELGPGPEPPDPPQGLYIYGSVGSGKTMLMDR